MKAISYSYVEYNPRVPLVFLKVEKIECEIFNSVLLLSFFLLLLLFLHAQLKKYKAYTNDPHTKRLQYYQRSSFCWLELHAS